MEVEPGCFPPDPYEPELQAYIDFGSQDGLIDPFTLSGLRFEWGFCEYEPGEYPPAFDGYPSHRVERVSVAFDIDQGASCAACPDEDVDALLRDAYARDQDGRMCAEDEASREIYAWELGCVSKVQIEGQWQCAYTAAVVSECDTEPNQSD